MKKPEILSPAGSMEALKAAIANEADAVYLGGKKFGARASSANFSDEEIVEAINFSHKHHVKVYVTMNTLVFDDEVESYLEYANFLYISQVDAIIVQDIGMFYLLRKNFPNLHLHCSTQMNIVNSLDGQYWVNRGSERIVLARENTGSDITSIKEKTGAELEVFVHGALCMAYSGKCLFGALEGGRSGNRGECSQPCRMKYSIDLGNKIIEEAYHLSTRDLSTITNIDEVLALPIDSFKIEGRMKRGEYVAKATSLYKQGSYGDKTKEELSKLENEIKHIFNRNYTKGYVLGDKGSLVSNIVSPKNQGMKVATVVENNQKKKRLKLRLLDELQVGDGLTTGEIVGRIIHKEKFLSQGKAGDIVELDYVGNLKEGDMVYKTYSKEIMETARATYENFKTNYPVDMKLCLKIGDSPRLILIDEGRTIEVNHETATVEMAKHQAISDDRIEQQLSKLGDSIYSLRNLEIERHQESSVAVAVLNQLRREATAIAEEKRTQLYDRESIKNLDYSLNIGADKEQPVSIGVFCNTKEQLKAAKAEKVHRIYVKTKAMYQEAVNEFETAVVFFQQPLVIREDELESNIKEIENLGDNFVVSSLGMADFLKEKCTVAHYLLNLTNEYSLGIVETDFAMPSLEVLCGGMDRLKSSQWYEKLEIPVYQRPILMVSEYCPYKKSNGHCDSSECKLEMSALKNQQGHKFPLEKDGNCKMLVLSKSVERLDRHIPELLRMGVVRYNINLQGGILAETYDESRKLIRDYKRLLF